MAACLVLALVALGFGYVRWDEDRVTLLESQEELATTQSRLNDYRSLAEVDALFHSGAYRESIPAYRALTGVAGDTIETRVRHATRLIALNAAMDTLRLLSDRDILPPSSTLPAPAPAPVKTDGLERTNPERFDSLTFALKKAEMQVRNLQQRMTRSSGPNYLTFESKKGNETYYVGEIKKGKAHGDGVALLSTGSRYFGQWKNNLKHGTGEFYWSDGAWYEGDYENDERSGQGTYHFPKGDVFTGEWKNDVRSGPGVFYDKKGKVVAKGIWKNDELVQ